MMQAMASGKAQPAISKVDLRGLELGTQGWEEARAAVFASMEAIGAVVVMNDALGADLHQALFGRAMPEFFALPLDVKRGLISGPVGGYIERSARAGLPAYESARIWETTGGGRGARNLGDGIWPHGNPAFCDTAIGTFAKNMMELERTVATMILESLGVGKEHVDAHHESIAHSLRLAHYGALPETGPTDGVVSVKVHRDVSVLTIIVQHEVEGLEVQVEDGSWVAVPPEPNAAAIVAGEMLTVATNGRVPASVHRVRTPSNRERLSALFMSMPKDGISVRPLDELVDDDHPPQYDPCNFCVYVDFRYAGEGCELSDPLKTFCGSRRG